MFTIPSIECDEAVKQTGLHTLDLFCTSVSDCPTSHCPQQMSHVGHDRRSHQLSPLRTSTQGKSASCFVLVDNLIPRFESHETNQIR